MGTRPHVSFPEVSRWRDIAKLRRAIMCHSMWRASASSTPYKDETPRVVPLQHEVCSAPTTFMVLGIPTAFSPDELAREWGTDGSWDLLYLPIGRQASVGLRLHQLRVRRHGSGLLLPVAGLPPPRVPAGPPAEHRRRRDAGLLVEPLPLEAEVGRPLAVAPLQADHCPRWPATRHGRGLPCGTSPALATPHRRKLPVDVSCRLEVVGLVVMLESPGGPRHGISLAMGGTSSKSGVSDSSSPVLAKLGGGSTTSRSHPSPEHHFRGEFAIDRRWACPPATHLASRSFA